MPQLSTLISWTDLLDVVVVTVFLYYILLWFRGTRAIPLLRGLIVVLLVYIVGRALNLHTINWLFDKFIAVIAVMLAIIFQPELRRTLERFGRGRILDSLGFTSLPRGSFLVRNIVRAVEQMAEDHVGALIVIERGSGLNEYLESGIRLDALLTSELLQAIFNQKSPLHDGAVIVQGERVCAAGCLLPLSDSQLLDKRLGTRHRAAVGISELSDALVIVLSEKTATISLAENGHLTRYLTRELLEEKLFSLKIWKK